MKKVALFFVIGLLFIRPAGAQTQDLTVQSEHGKLYLLHIVTPKENWYSIGRMYNISPKEIAPFNAKTLENPLSIGESIKIPLTANNFSQGGQKGADEKFVALYHTVVDNETLSHIGASFQNVPLDKLEKWNHTGKEQPKTGAQMVIGFLKVKAALSSLAGDNKDRTIADSAPKKIERKETTDSKTAAIAPEEKKGEAVEDKTPPVVNKEPKSTHTAAENKPPAVTNSTMPAKRGSGSYFSSEYNEGSRSASGLSGVFKSTSGWQDGKYYALLNNVMVGSIVKISSPATNKSIFAKVLGPLPDMKESAGLVARISNAGANELGENEGKFEVTVSY